MRTARVVGAGWAVILVGALARVAGATAVEADSGWFVDYKSEAGGAATQTAGTTWSLGPNSAKTTGCSDIKNQISGTKADIAGDAGAAGLTQTLKAQCQFSGAVASSFSRQPAGAGDPRPGDRRQSHG